MNTHLSIPDLIDNSRLSAFQWRVFALCFLVAILDGFDTQAIAFTGPSIIQAVIASAELTQLPKFH